VLALVIVDLDLKKSAESCFLNRNARDFDNPSIREALNTRACEFFGRFDDGLRYIKTRIET